MTHTCDARQQQQRGRGGGPPRPERLHPRRRGKRTATATDLIPLARPYLWLAPARGQLPPRGQGHCTPRPPAAGPVGCAPVEGPGTARGAGRNVPRWSSTITYQPNWAGKPVQPRNAGAASAAWDGCVARDEQGTQRARTQIMYAPTETQSPTTLHEENQANTKCKKKKDMRQSQPIHTPQK